MRFGPGFAPAIQTPSYRLSTQAAADIWRSRRSLDKILRCGTPAFGARRADAQGDSDWKGVLQCLGLICEAHNRASGCHHHVLSQVASFETRRLSYLVPSGSLHGTSASSAVWKDWSQMIGAVELLKSRPGWGGLFHIPS
jgi:hypothetical protein